jgi:putative transposase
MSSHDFKMFYKRKLPHYQIPDATLFITFRLVNSLHCEVLKRMEMEASLKYKELLKIDDPLDQQQAAYTEHKVLFGKWDNQLDLATSGEKWLANPQIAQMVCDSLHYRDGRQYTLEAYCVMSNHVHVVFTPLYQDGNIIPIGKIMQSLKGYTAWKANQMLAREGQFWQHESYDHLVRNNNELLRIVNYVLNNPIKGGLKNQYVYCRDTLYSCFSSERENDNNAFEENG